jgi:hypothetical protein
VVGVIYHVCTQGKNEWPISFENLVKTIFIKNRIYQYFEMWIAKLIDNIILK